MNLRAVLTTILLACSVALHGQLSPGDLARVHEHLEGISNCTQCHALGDKVSNDKCLACHDEIASLINTSRGYHASPEVRRQDCFDCHSDHYGRNFDMVRFNEESFDHDLTGYTLTGSHTTIDCRACHTPDNIDDLDIRAREGTFLGLDSQCASCHEDFHQGTLSNDCSSCHDTEAFRPAGGFDHATAAFELKGRHAEVACEECHAQTVRNGRDFQQFTGLEFSTCVACHTDAHNGRLGTQCAQCHVETGFSAVATRTAFNHSITSFPLEGAHNRISCASCHDVQVGATSVYSDFDHVDAITCTNCHEDIHEGRFGTNCTECHTVVSFTALVETGTFNHSLTDFPLEGMHATVECQQCHTEHLTDPVAHSQCIDCHDDYHDGQLTTVDGMLADCIGCHTVHGFSPTTFDMVQHAQTDFPLEGGHLATPCFACHLSEDGSWQFDNIGLRCADCHEDIHEDLLAETYYPDKNCTSCHNPEGWRFVAFDHTATDFGLEGEHASIACVNCHVDSDAGQSITTQPFAGLDTHCSACHNDEHRGQFAISGTTDCSGCHTPIMWQPSTFDHDSARFVLDGAHVNVECNACHTTKVDNSGAYVLYHLDEFECIACH